MPRLPWLPGLLVASGIGLFTSGVQPLTGHALPFIDPITAALLAGMLVGNLAGAHSQLHVGTHFAGHHILSLAVVLLGASLHLGALRALPLSAWLGVLLAMGAVLFAGRPLGRLLGLRTQTAFLIAAGTAICGSSAIAAIAPMVPDREESDVGIAVAVVNLLGAGLMVVLPVIFTALHLSSEHSAVLLGGSLQAVGHVVGAAGGLPGDLVELATAVKMGRVGMLIPIVLLLGLLRPAASTGTEAPRHRLPIPPYLVGFVLLSLLTTVGFLPPGLVAGIKPVAKLLLAVAMAGIGASVRVGLLQTAGPRALLLGVVAFGVQLGVCGAGLLF